MTSKQREMVYHRHPREKLIALSDGDRFLCFISKPKEKKKKNIKDKEANTVISVGHHQDGDVVAAILLPPL